MAWEDVQGRIVRMQAELMPAHVHVYSFAAYCSHGWRAPLYTYICMALGNTGTHERDTILRASPLGLPG